MLSLDPSAAPEAGARFRSSPDVLQDKGLTACRRVPRRGSERVAHQALGRRLQAVVAYSILIKGELCLAGLPLRSLAYLAHLILLEAAAQSHFFGIALRRLGRCLLLLDSGQSS